MHTRIRSAALGGLLVTAAALGGCKSEARAGDPDASRGAVAGGAGSGARSRTLVLGGYSTPREVYGREIIPAFQRYWKQKTGEDVAFKESYLGSGAQARAIAGGFEADVAALSLDPDIETIAKAGLITRDWKAAPHGGMVSRSIVVIGVRAGNPKGVKD